MTFKSEQTKRPSAAWLIFVPVVLLLIGRAGTISEGDVFWETRAGINLVNGAGVVHGDVLSWTAEGMRWIPNSWGWNVVLSLFWRIDNFVGLGLLGFVAGTALLIALVVQSINRGASVFGSGVVLLLSIFGLEKWISPRPQMATYFAVLIVVALFNSFLKAHSEGRRQKWLFLAYIFASQLIAINLHFGALILLPLVSAAYVAWWWNFRKLDGFLLNALVGFTPVIAIVIASCINPIGIDVWSHAINVRDSSTQLINEWKPGWKDGLSLLCSLLGIITGVLTWKQRRMATAGALLCASVLAFFAVRFVPITLILLVPEASVWVTNSRVIHKFLNEVKLFFVPAFAVLSLALLPNAIAGITHFGAPEPDRFSERAVLLLPQGCRLFNDYQNGGLVSLLRPDIKVSVDGRNDFFGSRIKQQLEIWRTESTTWLDDNAVTCVLFSRTDSGSSELIESLKKSENWQIILDDENHVALKRSTEVHRL